MKTKTSSIIILARQNMLTQEEWFQLIELRLEMIQPHLRDMSLGNIGDLKMIYDYFGDHLLKRGDPQIESDGQLNLETRGIFPISNGFASTHTEVIKRDRAGHPRNEIKKLWGLTRNGEWITIKVNVIIEEKPYHSGRTVERSHPEKVTINKSSLKEICRFSKSSPRTIWERFGEVVKEWSNYRKHLYERAQNLEQTIMTEETIMKLIKVND